VLSLWAPSPDCLNYFEVDIQQFCMFTFLWRRSSVLRTFYSVNKALHTFSSPMT
jgi:hypothetical protein